VGGDGGEDMVTLRMWRRALPCVAAAGPVESSNPIHPAATTSALA